MEQNLTIQPALQQFADHFEQIVLKNAALKQDFKDRIDHRHLSMRQLSLLETFASVTLAEDLKRGDINWWATFTDYMKKTVSILKTDFPDLQQLALGEMIVFTRWTTQSFMNILNIEDVIDVPPPFPARPSDIRTIPVLLSYLEKNLIPVMTQHLEASMKLPHERLEQFLDEKAAFFIHGRVPGVETFWYAPAEIRHEEPSAPAL